MEKPSIVQQLATQLLSKDTPHPKRLVIIAQLNRHFLEAPTFEKCAADVEQLPQGVLPLVFSLVSSGEPHVYLALNLLHFACFAPSHRTNLLRLKAAPFLAGLLRAGGEHELCRAALSLLAKKKSTGNQQRELDSILRELAIYEKRLKTAAYQ
eukprot:gene10860-12855_t